MKVKGTQGQGDGLGVIMDLLDKDYLSQPDLGFALRDVAGMVREALQADITMVALWNEAGGRWWGITHEGARLEDTDIRRACSLSVLEQVYRTGEAVRGDAGQIPAQSSAHRLQIDAVLALPLMSWVMGGARPERALFGCLYAHRVGDAAPFTEAEARLAKHIAAVTQPTLGVLRVLGDVQRALETREDELRILRERSEQIFALGSFQTRSPLFSRSVLEPLRRAARGDRINLVLEGPTGAGKTHLAEAYHYESPRGKGPFVVMDCAQASSELALSAELFGYAANSGISGVPSRGRAGKAAAADGGTLFMDEIGCLSLPLQQALLRLVERGAFTPMGGAKEERVDVQILAATNLDLPTQVREGRFREDLYWRLAELRVLLPPLEQRPEDIGPLAARFAAEAATRYGIPPIPLGPEALRTLLKVPWSRYGNIRGLAQVVRRSVLMAPEGRAVLEAEDLVMEGLDLHAPPEAAASPPETPAPREAQAPEDPELTEMKAAIRSHRNGRRAAKALGLSYGQLIYRLGKYNLGIIDVIAEAEGDQ